MGGETILSTEGTTQGDPLSTVIYAVATLPLIRSVEKDGLSQTWFADDAGAGSKLLTLHGWWRDLLTEGPKYGYHVNPSKTWLVTKEPHLDAAQWLFGASAVRITTEGGLFSVHQLVLISLRVISLTARCLSGRTRFAHSQSWQPLSHTIPSPRSPTASPASGRT